MEAQPDIVRYLVAAGAAAPPLRPHIYLMHCGMIHPAVAAAACKDPELSVELVRAIPGHEALFKRSKQDRAFDSCDEPFRVAAMLGTHVGSKPLLELLENAHGAELFVTIPWEDHTCMHEAAKRGNLPLLRWICARGNPHPPACDYDNQTPMICAAEEGHAHIVRYLLSIGHPAHTEGGSGERPLVSALDSEDVETINVVVEALRAVGGFDLYGVPSNDDVEEFARRAAFAGATSGLCWLVAYGTPYIELGRVLLDACSGGSVPAVRFLMAKGCDPMASVTVERRPSDQPGQRRCPLWRYGHGRHVPVKATPLYEACWAGHVDVVRFIVGKLGLTGEQLSGAEKGRPLTGAAAAGSLPLLRFLAEECGAKASLPDGGDPLDTALRAACRHGHVDAARYLVEEMHMPVGGGVGGEGTMTPMAEAVQGEHAAVQSVLLALGAGRVTELERERRVQQPSAREMAECGVLGRRPRSPLLELRAMSRCR